MLEKNKHGWYQTPYNRYDGGNHYGNTMWSTGVTDYGKPSAVQTPLPSKLPSYMQRREEDEKYSYRNPQLDGTFGGLYSADADRCLAGRIPRRTDAGFNALLAGLEGLGRSPLFLQSYGGRR